jgi:hypothetical protein
MSKNLQRRHFIAIYSISAGALLVAPAVVFGQSFDTSYSAWDALLKKHVTWLPDNKQSRVDYKGFAADRVDLKKVLDSFSAVTPAQFAALPKTEQMVFLINAYNAFTIAHILEKYPDISSIKDLGSLFQSAWKKKFFKLLGEERDLEWIEHEQLRAKYQEPRIHVALVCAAISCPALRTDAYTSAKLEAQLEDSMQRFLGDKTRNRYADGRLQVSSIFKWFKEDFEKGYKGFNKVEDVFAKYAEALGTDATSVAQIRAKTVSISYLDYDWSLNDIGR